MLALKLAFESSQMELFACCNPKSHPGTNFFEMVSANLVYQDSTWLLDRSVYSVCASPLEGNEFHVSFSYLEPFVTQ